MRKNYIAVPIMFFSVLMICSVNTSAQSACGTSIENTLPTINVVGYGKITSIPDEAIIMFGVTSEEKDLTKAYGDNIDKMNKIIDTVKMSGIEAKGIKTSSFSVVPIYPRDTNGRQMPGKPVSYRVSQQLTVKVSDISKMGGIIDKVISDGTNIFNGIQFTSSKNEELQMEAKVEAVKDAKEKAELLARNLGVSIGRVIKVTESSQQPYPVRTRMMAYDSAMVKAAPQVEAGSMEVTATCNVIYEIIQ